ncbi:SLAM family member 9-like [Cynoglossus semilaevis]|uniref:SLAM family member 9-like n=1 Tax=Cynoglossus semilaevis TaxID=244447 RepID=UPI000D62D82A|nr:SLAM family member 9-like [Cynoglossus semilaevis]
MARYFLTCWCVLTCSLQVFGQTPSYFLIGQTFHLKPIMSEQPDKILWKHNGKKLVEFNGKEEHVYGQHQHRATLDWITAELNITHVRYEDTGVYELDASNSNMVYQFFYRLQVIGKVSKPTITCTVRKGDSDESGPEATLTCSAESTRSESLVKYEWQSGGNVVPGQKLTIPLGDEHDNQIHTCRVNNPLSNEVETFTARSCYSDGGLSVGLVVGIVVVVLIILSVVLGILFCKRARKGCFAKTSKGDVEKQTPRGKEQDKKKKIFHEENLKLLTVGDSGGKKPKWPPSPLGQFYSPDLPNVTSGEKSHTEEGHVKRRVSEIEKQSTGKKPEWLK